MADNTQVNNGTGDTVRDVDRTGVKTQVVLLDVAATGASELLGLGQTKAVKANAAGLTTSTTSYTAGDVLGSEISVASAVRSSGGGGAIVSARLIDYAKVTGTVDGFIFDSASTPVADNAANSWADADMDRLLGVINFETPIASALNSFARGVGGLPIAIQPAVSTLYVVLVTRSAHTFFGAATDLRLILGIQQD